MEAIRVAWAPVADARRRAVADELLHRLAPGREVSRVCPRCGGDHGAPRLTPGGLLASTTYVRDGMNRVATAVAAVIDGRGLVGFGIDAERGDASDASDVVGVATLREWVRLEAAAKADGRLLRLDPTSVVVHTAGSTWTASLPSAPDVRGRDLPGPPGSVLSAAWRSA
ncbi:MAG: chemotaxis protein CheY [Microbacterium sp.]|uniref:chemotaxis protein CheY n=1 Tax=unclassified Microbacterium TaxID=2609290 RepID=UPI000C4936D3|nr:MULTISPECIES: chemotaxis protein CheY [unclassified Microbacterium]MAY49410.1 chemotaxis protein CheY [Microbacterium sp.]HBS73552.1 chemotaxis protein CheY [Microbacterium sp.]